LNELSLVVITAGMGTPSTTQLLGERLGAATASALSTAGHEVEVTHLELRTIGSDLTNYLVSRVPSKPLQDAFATVRAASGVIAVTPVFNASYSGLFKMFFDLLDEGSLKARPALLAATGGTARHSLVIDQAMLPLFHYLKAVVVPTGVFAATADWGESDGRLTRRIEAAGVEFAELVASRPGQAHADEFAAEINFADLLGQ